MQTAFQLLLVALQIGAVYVLFSLGLTLIFGVMRIINFAHGQFFTLSALVVAFGVSALTGAGWSVYPAFALSALAAVALSAALGLLLYRFGFYYFQRDMIGSFVLSIGFVLVLEGIFLKVFGGQVRSVTPLIEGNVTIAGVSLTTQRLVLCIIAVILTLTLYRALGRTKLGLALRAVSIDHEAAMLQGVPYQKIARQGFMIGTLLASIAGILIAPTSVITTTLGSDYLIKGFIAVVLGGLGSIPGAIVGSLFVATVETVGGYFFDPSKAAIAVFCLVMVILLVRPKGLLGHG